MDIQNNNVTIQINATDKSGKKLRISDCDVFVVHVFTDDPKFYLTFSKRDMLMTEWVDELTIPKHQMEQLRSGVVQYTYDYLPVAHECKYEQDNEFDEEAAYRPHHPHHGNHTHFHEELIHSKPVVTSIYWRNIAHPHHERPLNTVTLFDVERLHRLIEKERIEREKDVESLQEQFGEGFSDRLDAEIERSTVQDELHNSMILDIQKSIEEIEKTSASDKDDTDKEISTNATDIVNEVARATAKEIELEQMIQGEVSRAKSVEEVIDTKITMEKERATANESNINDRLVSLTDRFDAYKELSSETLKSEIERAKATESALNDKIQGVIGDLANEVSRAAQKDIEHTNLVVTEANRAEAVENKIATDLATEVARAKDAEKHILDEVHGVQETVANLATATNVYTKSEVDKKVSDVRNDVSTVQNWMQNHGDDTSALKVKVDNLVVDVDKAKADILAEVAKCDAENGKLATDIQTLADSTYTKAEVDSQVSVIDSSIAGIKNWIDNHTDNTEGLSEKVNKNIADIQALTTDLSNEVTNRVNADLTLTTKVEVAEGKVDAELIRAKAAEKLISDEVAEIKAQALAKHTDIETAIAEVDANLTLEIARAKAAEKVCSDAIEIINGDVSTAGSIKKSLADGKAYTDAEIAKLSLAKDVEIADTLTVYAKKSDVDTAIQNVIGTAPEALDTLGKISDALGQDSDAISAINGILAGKADSSIVYSKTDVDIAITGVNNTISTLETKVDNADATISGRIDDLSAKVTGVEANIANDSSVINAKIDAEVVRAKAAEKANSDKIDEEIQKLTDKHNELNAKVIQDIADSTAKDTEIDANISALNTLLNNVEAKIDAEIARATAKDNELVAEDVSISAKVQAVVGNLADEVVRAKAAEKSLSDKIDALDLTGAENSIAALDTKIDNVQTSIQAVVDAEVIRATAAENALSGKIDIINGDASTAGSIAHAVEDAKHHIDDKLLDYYDKATFNEIIDGCATRGSVSELASELGNTKATIGASLMLKANSSDVYTKSEVDTLIANVDVTEQLKDYVTNASVAEVVNQAVADSSQFVSLQDALDAEVARAKAAEKEITDSIQTVSEIVEAAVDDLNSLFDSSIAGGGSLSIVTRDEIETLLDDYYTKDEITQVMVDMASKSEVESLESSVNAKFGQLDTSISGTIQAAQLMADVLNDINSSLSSFDASIQNVYTKEYVDALVDVVDGKINAKLPIESFNEWSEGVALKANVYSKTEVDSLIPDISGKADASAVYTKDEVNELIQEVTAMTDIRYLRGVPVSADEYQALVDADEIEDNVLYIII